MNIIAVLPARYNSTRLPYKMLRHICGKPLVQWAWENAQAAKMVDTVIIACDDAAVYQAAKNFGAQAVMTSTGHHSGTDRIAEAVRDIDADIIINVQADEPLLHPSIIDAVAQTMIDDERISMATARTTLTEHEADNPHTVKVICDRNGYALYFSRYPIPFYRDPAVKRTFYKHIGVYAYTKDFLFTFKNLPQSHLEESEKLEQLRALEAGYRIKVIDTSFDTIGVDTEADLLRAETEISKRLRGN